jgi:hypothetical protein
MPGNVLLTFSHRRKVTLTDDDHYERKDNRPPVVRSNFEPVASDLLS